VVRYQFGNLLGSASLELDDHADIISYEEYTPYGGTSFQAVRSQTETPKRYRFSGKERDDESGLYYHGARYYAPWLGRWVSADPVGIADGVCLYAYAGGNPVKFVDPTGTTITVSGNVAVGGTEQIQSQITTTQRLAEEAFLRDIRAGLPSSEQSLFTISAQTHHLQFTGNRKKLDKMSGFAQLLVGQIDSKTNIVILPAVFAAANRGNEAQSLIDGTFLVGRTATERAALVQTGRNYNGIPGSTRSDKGTIFVAYVTGTTVRAPRPGLPDVAGKPFRIDDTLKDFFFQGNILQTLTHELAAHVEGKLRGEPNNDGHLSRSIPAPGGKTSTLLDFANDTKIDPPFKDVLKNTSLAPFERSLKLEREVLAQFKTNLGNQQSQGGDPDKRKAYVDVIKRAMVNQKFEELDATVNEFIGSGNAFKVPPSNWPPPLQMNGRPVQ
jgi:RHS repeat-associated protein